MSEREEDKVSGTSGWTTRFKHRAYICIETLRGKTGREIDEALTEACGSDIIGYSLPLFNAPQPEITNRSF